MPILGRSSLHIFSDEDHVIHPFKIVRLNDAGVVGPFWVINIISIVEVGFVCHRAAEGAEHVAPAHGVEGNGRGCKSDKSLETERRSVVVAAKYMVDCSFRPV